MVSIYGNRPSTAPKPAAKEDSKAPVKWQDLLQQRPSQGPVPAEQKTQPQSTPALQSWNTAANNSRGQLMEQRRDLLRQEQLKELNGANAPVPEATEEEQQARKDQWQALMGVQSEAFNPTASRESALSKFNRVDKLQKEGDTARKDANLAESMRTSKLSTKTDFGNAKDKVRQLTPEEWDNLTPMQQRAVESNYELYKARNDPERQKEVLSRLGMDANTTIDGYASYEDILALEDFSDESNAKSQQFFQNRMSATPQGEAPTFDSQMQALVNLANSAYQTRNGQNAQSYAGNAMTAGIRDKGNADFSSLSLIAKQQNWLTKRLLPVIADDNRLASILGDQKMIDGLYQDLEKNLPGASRAQIGDFLQNAGLSQNISDMEQRLQVLGLKDYNPGGQ